MKKLIALLVALMMIFACTAMAEGKTVAPEAGSFDPLKDEGVIAKASFEGENVKVAEDGTVTIELTLFTEDAYDLVDISQLAPGDKVIVDGEEIVVETVTNENGFVEVNGGFSEEGATFCALEDTNGMFAMTYDDDIITREVCTVTLPVSANVAFHDESDLEAEPIDVDTAEAMVASINAMEFPFFNSFDTEVTIENGVIVGVNHFFHP